MAHHKSAKKRLRRSVARTAINRARISRIRTFIKKVETAVDANDLAGAQAALKEAAPEIQRGVNKGVLAKSTAARRISRLNSRVKALHVAAA